MEQGRPDRRHHLDLTAVPIHITAAWTIVANNVDRRHFVSWSSLSRNRSTSCCCYCCPVAVPPAKASGFGKPFVRPFLPPSPSPCEIWGLSVRSLPLKGQFTGTLLRVIAAASDS